MEMIDRNTTLFKNIFPDYESFSNWYSRIPLSGGGKNVPSEVTFTLIAYEYNDSHVAMSPEGFMQHFAIDLYTYYKEFEATTKAIDGLMSLTESDIMLGDRLITNVGDVPETPDTTNALALNYVSQQNKQITEKGRLRIKREELTTKRAYTVRAFLKKFRHLFIKVLSPAYTFVVQEKEGE